MSPIQDEIDAYDAIQGTLEADHRGEWVLMRDRQVVGFFPSFDLIAAEATKRFGRGPYLIREIGAPPLTRRQ